MGRGFRPAALHPAAVHRSCAHRGCAAPSSRCVHLRARIRAGRRNRRPRRRSLRRVLRSPAGPRGQIRRARRLLPDAPPPGAIAAGGLYTATEFDVQGLDVLRPSLVEMGRAVVREDHRNGGVVLLMWAGILAYLDRCGYDYVTGCVSVPVDGATEAHPAARSAACGTSSAAVTRPCRAHRVSVSAGDGRRQGSGRHRPAARVAVPPLMRGYLRSARRCAAIQPTIRTSEWATSRRCWTNAGPISDTRRLRSVGAAAMADGITS